MNWYKKYSSYKFSFPKNTKEKIAQVPHIDTTNNEDVYGHEGYRNLRNDFYERNKEELIPDPELFPNQNPVTVKDYIEGMFPNAKPLSAGVYGVAYALGDRRILKLTTDPTEVFFANKFKMNPHPRIVDIYDVMFIHDNIYGIIMEHVLTLTEQEESYVKALSLTMTDMTKEDLIEDQHRYNDSPFFSEFVQLLIDLNDAPAGFKPHDAHSGNVGYNSKGKMVLFDLGINSWFNDDDMMKNAQTIPHEYKMPEDISFEENSGYHQVNTRLDNHKDQIVPDPNLFPNEKPTNIKQYIEKIFPNATPMAAGTCGVAYDLQDGRVLKLTSDQTEIMWGTHFKQNPHPSVVDVYDIMIIHDDLYGLIMEKIQPLSTEQQDIIYRVPRDLSIYRSFEELQQFRNQYSKSTLVQKYIDMLINLKKIEFPGNDVYEHNVGIKPNGKMALLDLGHYKPYGHGIDEDIVKEVQMRNKE